MGAKDRLKQLMVLRAEREISRESPTRELAPDVRGKIAVEVASAVAHREHVSAAIGRISRELKTPSPSPAFSAARATSVAAPAAQSAFGAPHIAQALRKSPTPHVPVPVDGRQAELWATIAKQAHREQLEHHAQERLARAEKIRQQKKILDEQVAVRREAKSTRASEQRVERQIIDGLKVVWEKEQKTVEQVHRDIAEKLRSDREQQVEERQQRRNAEAAERKKADEAILQRIDLEVEDQRQRAKALKEREVRIKAELILANEEQKKIKAAHIAHEAELEARCIKEMELRLEKQAQDRQRAWNAMKEKMKGREALALELQATVDEKAAADEARAAAVTEARYRERGQREINEQQKRKAGLLKVLEFQCRQIEDRNRALEEEQAAKRVERARIEHIVEESSRIIEQKRREARGKLDKQRSILEEQMRDNARYQTVVISDEEKLLNKHILERAEGIESPSNFKRLQSPI